MIERLMQRGHGQADIAWLVAFRVLFGSAICVSMIRFIAYGWIDALFVEPGFHFKYWGFGWVEPLPAGPMHGLFYALALLAACVAAGLFYRVAIWGLLLGFVYIQLIDVTTYLNHYYLASWLLLLLALAPAHHSGSLDAWLRPALARASCARGWHWLFRFQIGVIYTFAGLAKAQSDWLLHAQPLGIWLGSRTDIPLLGNLFRADEAAWLMSWGGFLFDTTIIWFLLWSRTRVFAYAVVLMFHSVVGVLFPIGMFPILMMVGALSFFPPDWPRRLLGPDPARGKAAEPSPTGRLDPRASRLLWACAAAYCAAHLVMPLRHHLYGGNVLWDEQGMRWSWKVMVREKNATLTYLVRDPKTGREVQVAPRRYLNRWQEREMAGQPDLILQLAHHIRDEYAARLGEDVQVRVESAVSLNGRAAAPLVDPRADLARVDDGILPAHWILPAPQHAPPQLERL
jgi:vitamin K-dependent gamma-carboxylase